MLTCEDFTVQHLIDKTAPDDWVYDKYVQFDTPDGGFAHRVFYRHRQNPAVVAHGRVFDLSRTGIWVGNDEHMSHCITSYSATMPMTVTVGQPVDSENAKSMVEWHVTRQIERAKRLTLAAEVLKTFVHVNSTHEMNVIADHGNELREDVLELARFLKIDLEVSVASHRKDPNHP